MLHEVRNTFGHRHTYAVAVQRTGLRHGTAKNLHVSPFNDMDQSYRFSMNEPGGLFALGIAVDDRNGNLFRAGMRLRRREWSDRKLARLFVTHPLLTLKVMGAIHWQAFKIWRKGGRYHRVPDPPSHRFTVAEPVGAQR